VCHVLGYVNSREELRKHVDEGDITKRDVLDISGWPQQINVINESGLYSLVLVSRKPEAKLFKKWVTSDPMVEKACRCRYM
jgi:anti-repressor protein